MSRRAPWWMYLLAASFLGTAAVAVYLEFGGPEYPGINFVPSTSGFAIADSVTPGSPAARAGVEPGDRLLALNGEPVRNGIDWAYVLSGVESGRPLRLEIERGGVRRQVVLILGRRSGGPGDID